MERTGSEHVLHGSTLEGGRVPFLLHTGDPKVARLMLNIVVDHLDATQQCNLAIHAVSLLAEEKRGVCLKALQEESEKLNLLANTLKHNGTRRSEAEQSVEEEEKHFVPQQLLHQTIESDLLTDSETSGLVRLLQGDGLWLVCRYLHARSVCSLLRTCRVLSQVLRTPEHAIWLNLIMRDCSFALKARDCASQKQAEYARAPGMEGWDIRIIGDDKTCGRELYHRVRKAKRGAVDALVLSCVLSERKTIDLYLIPVLERLPVLRFKENESVRIELFWERRLEGQLRFLSRLSVMEPTSWMQRKMFGAPAVIPSKTRFYPCLMMDFFARSNVNNGSAPIVFEQKLRTWAIGTAGPYRAEWWAYIDERDHDHRELIHANFHVGRRGNLGVPVLPNFFVDVFVEPK